MHSSTVLSVDDIYLTDARTHRRCAFSTLCPDYTPRDRIAFVCDASAHGALHVGRTVLALTAAFYAPLREQDTPFFDYPQHFALITGIEDQASLPETVTRCWTHLDVWPASQWIALSSDRAEVLSTICSLQINRLFWPADRLLSTPSQPLPTHIYKLLNTRLTQILTYGHSEAQADIEVALSGGANELWEQALTRCDASGPYPEADQLCSVDVEAFLEQQIDAFIAP